ncbi:MAG: hypothetical protein RSJ41_09695 [Clostridia bacterium]
MDNFKEEVAIRRKTFVYNLLYVLSWVALVVSALACLFGLQGVLMMLATGSFELMPLLVTLLFGACAFLLFRSKDGLRVEYEYTFTNGELDVSKVLNNQKRKYLTSLNMKNVEAAGAVASPAFSRYATMPDIKKHNWFLNRDARLYYYYFNKNAVKHLIVVELSDEMAALTHQQNYMGYGVWQA